MWRVVIGAEILEFQSLEDLRRGFGIKAEYVPDCGTRGDILIRHPLNPNYPIRAMLVG